MRTLTTIGDLRTMRDVSRQARLAPMMGFSPSLRALHMGLLGATNPNFAPPSGLDSGSMGADLSNALNALLQAYTASGVPAESTADPSASAFQTAWNADPAVSAVGGNALLAVDGGYGPNTALAVSTINGGSFPPVNGGAAPAPMPGTTPANPLVAPAAPGAVTPAGAASSHTMLWLLALLAAAGAAYAAHRMLKKKNSGGRRRAALPSRAIVLT
jgi:hypothetical protein